MPGDAIEVEVVIDAPRELVFSYFVDPVKFTAWQGVAARLDPRPGGEFWLNVTGREIASGRFVEVDPPARVVFTWGWEQTGATIPPGRSLVEVSLEAFAGRTRVTLRHSSLPTVADQTSHRDGWAHYLHRLCSVATGCDPGDDPWTTPGRRHLEPSGEPS